MAQEIDISEGYKKACFLLGDALTRLSLTEDYMPKSASDFYEPKHLRVEPDYMDAYFDEPMRGTINHG